MTQFCNSNCHPSTLVSFFLVMAVIFFSASLCNMFYVSLCVELQGFGFGFGFGFGGFLFLFFFFFW